MKSSVRRLLTHTITNNLAQEINWMGKGEKVAFSKLNLLTVLKGKKKSKNTECLLFFSILYIVWIVKQLNKEIQNILVFIYIFLAAVRKNRLCASATDAEIASVAKDWFRFAKDREGGRKKREERKKRKEAIQATEASDPDSE